VSLLNVLRQSWRRRTIFGTYIALFAFLLAHSVNVFVAYSITRPSETPVAAPVQQDEPVEAPDPQALAQSILSGGLFALPANPNAVLAGGQPSVPTPPPLNVAKKVSLIGTALNSRTGGIAILQDLSSKQQTLYHLNDAVTAVGTIVDIQKSRILLRAGNQEEWLDLAIMQQVPSDTVIVATPAVTQTPSPPQVKMLDRRELTALVADPTRLMTQALAVPYLSNGKLDGFRLYNVVPQGFFNKIGLETNDIVQRINGAEIRDPGMLLSLFQQLANERVVRVDLIRLTQRHTLTYEIR
jgi:general secretion pathway protein C